jgi:MFS superfamily sulfate permease-like transporter
MEFFFYLIISGIVYALVRKIRNLPWFIVFTTLSVLLGYLMHTHKNVLALNIAFKGYEELFTFFGHPFTHFFSFKVFWYKACSGEFIMHMLFFTAAVFVESVTSIRVARSHHDRTSDESAEILGLSLTNIVFGCLGLLPVSIPVARNILAYETGANNKIYHLFSAGLLFSMAFLF